jgi:hypothetical protein
MREWTVKNKQVYFKSTNKQEAFDERKDLSFHNTIRSFDCYSKQLFPRTLMIHFIPRFVTIGIGVVMLLIGIIFYISTAKTFFTQFKKGKLITTGTYNLQECCK